ncbi:MAG: type II toxin-antitoxin system PemK/MazF family toxin [Planctomycetes bacterium]|nr:type II toxin-antitoxin system PemK/MazF family toxin [Planctomycetota bacterium]
MSSASSPQRGEVWLADLDPTFGHEQGGRRPVLVVSVDSFNAGLSGLVVVLPITSRIRPVPLHIPVDPPEGSASRSPNHLAKNPQHPHRLPRKSTPLQRDDDGGRMTLCDRKR